MQYATPQFIESDAKIIFFLTFKQFFWLVGAGAACILLYMILPFYVFIVAALMIVALIAAIAFVKIDNTSLIKIFFNFLGFTVASKTYTWKRTVLPRKNAESYLPAQVGAEKRWIEKPPETFTKPPLVIRPSKLGDIKKIIETKK